MIQENRRVGFTYTTTSMHSEVGEWSPAVLWRDNGEVALVIDVVSRTKPGASAISRWFARRMQLRAHEMSIQNFLGQLSLRPVTVRSETFPAEILPVGVLAAALLLLAAALRITRKSK